MDKMKIIIISLASLLLINCATKKQENKLLNTSKTTKMKEFWNDRYSKDSYAYGSTPNEFLKQELVKLEKGKILFPAEGEGRNAVFAANEGWIVDAFDLSEEGQKKALKLAEQQNVTIDYQVGEFSQVNYEKESFDAIVLIFAHFPTEVKSEYHKKLATYLKKGGVIIFEAFSKKHLEYNSVNPNVGGPKNIDMLFSIEEIENDFKGFEIIKLSEETIELNEGDYHIGQGSVIRFVGRKIK